MPTDRNHNGAIEVSPEIARATAELERAEKGLALSVGALEEEIARTLDVREWVRRRPGVSLAVAFGIGFLVGRKSHGF